MRCVVRFTLFASPVLLAWFPAFHQPPLARFPCYSLNSCNSQNIALALQPYLAPLRHHFPPPADPASPVPPFPYFLSCYSHFFPLLLGQSLLILIAFKLSTIASACFVIRRAYHPNLPLLLFLFAPYPCINKSVKFGRSKPALLFLPQVLKIFSSCFLRCINYTILEVFGNLLWYFQYVRQVNK